jgi:hypothetical protein
MNTHKAIFVLSTLLLIGIIANGQEIPLGETILVSNSSLKENADPESIKSYMLKDLIPAWNQNSPGPSLYLLQADRGDRNGELLTICMAAKPEDRKKLNNGSPFTDKAVATIADDLADKPSTFLDNPDAYTEYQLIGGDRITPLPSVDLLGIHYLKVKPEKAKDFEKLVVEKLHPAVGRLVHDMNLLYYKAVDGQNKGTFITIYAIESVEARERFWPTGGQEQDIVKQLFGPYKELAKELGTYYIEGTFLGPESGGGAAYFESLEWTDFVVIDSK